MSSSGKSKLDTLTYVQHFWIPILQSWAKDFQQEYESIYLHASENDRAAVSRQWCHQIALATSALSPPLLLRAILTPLPDSARLWSPWLNRVFLHGCELTIIGFLRNFSSIYVTKHPCIELHQRSAACSGKGLDVLRWISCFGDKQSTRQKQKTFIITSILRYLEKQKYISGVRCELLVKVVMSAGFSLVVTESFLFWAELCDFSSCLLSGLAEPCVSNAFDTWLDMNEFHKWAVAD